MTEVAHLSHPDSVSRRTSSVYAVRRGARSSRFAGETPKLRRIRFRAASATLDGAVISVPIG